MQPEHAVPRNEKPQLLMPVAAFHPGQRSFESGSGHGSNSEGFEFRDGAQLPGNGRSKEPPGHIARSEGHSMQESPEPYAHVV